MKITHLLRVNYKLSPGPNQIDKQEHAHPPRPEVRPEAGGERDLGRRTTSNDW